MDDKEKQIPVMTPGDMERLEQDKIIQRRLSKIKRKILVMSGKGGVGKSTVAAYLALLLSDKGRKVGLLDVDLHGPTIPHLLNLRSGLEIAGPRRAKPYPVSENLRAVSLEMVLGDKDAAVIWRGPLKIGAIRQFISDIEWGEMDYLIIDAPPGTGDEPLTVAQTVRDAKALIVTTPQEISLADVRKSINFCRQVKMRILGVVENMSGLACPHCQKTITVFGAGGGAKMASQMKVPMLGEIPIDPQMVELGDTGRLMDLVPQKDLPINKAYVEIVDRIDKG
ncbi:MAG: Mrp/NBP35 family ATP-binding protein [Deltaproteobacteria bacterium]|jgi:ATP-binding protein involved in chromosome partitioning